MTVVRLSVRAPRGHFMHWGSLFGLSVLVHLGVLLGIIVLPRIFRPRLKFPEIYSVNLVSLPAGTPGPSASGPPAEKASAPAPPAPAPPAPKPAPAPPAKAKAEAAIKIPVKPTVKPPKKKQVAKLTPPPPPKSKEPEPKPKEHETKAESSAGSQESAEKAAPTSPETAAGGGGGKGSSTAAVQGAGAQGTGTGGAGGSGGMVDDPAFQFGWYVSHIQSIVSRNWSQPILQDIRASLVAVVHFRVHKDGSVDEIVLERSSGDSVLDRSAVRALQDSNPLPPLPFQWSKESIGFRFEFEIHPD